MFVVSDIKGIVCYKLIKLSIRICMFLNDVSILKTNLYIGELQTITYHSPLLIMAIHITVIVALKFLYYFFCIAFTLLRWEFHTSSSCQNFALKGSWLPCLLFGWWKLLHHRLSGISYRRRKISSNNNLSWGSFLLVESLETLHYIYICPGTLHWETDEFLQCDKGK